MRNFFIGRLKWLLHAMGYALIISALNNHPAMTRTVEMQGATVQDKRSETIDSIMNEWFDVDGPGGVMLIVKDGSPIFCRAYGLASLEHNVPMTPATVFNIASMDKQFTGFALALLIEEGLISLDDEVHRYLPELPDYGFPITIRQMVNHTSGLPDEFSLLQMAGFWTDDVITSDQVFKLLLAQTHLLFHPGEKWQYSNSNYSLIAKIVERISGDRFSEFCRHRIFEPLGMTKTRFLDDHKTLVRDRASAYEYSDSGYMHIPVNYSPSLYTTAEDLIDWINNFENPRVGSSEVMDLISQTGYLNNGEPVDYAFGQFIKKYRGFKSYQHSGHVGAYTCFMVRFPELHLAVACLSNAGYFGATSTVLGIADLYLPAENEGANEPIAPDTDIMPALEGGSFDTVTVTILADPLACTGIYQIEATMKILRIRYDPPVMSLIHLSDVPLPLIPDVNGKFKMEGVGSKLSFCRDDSGNVVGLNLHMGNQILAAPKIKSVMLPHGQIRRLTGDYYAPELMTVCHIDMADSGLIVEHSRHATNFLTATDSLNFVGEQKWLRQLKFETDIEGDITGFKGSSGYARDIRFEKIR